MWWLGKISASTTEDKVYLVLFSGRPGVDLTSFSPGALHGVDGSRTRLLLPASSHRQRVSSGGPTQRRWDLEAR